MMFAFGRVEYDRRTWWYRSLPLHEAQQMTTRGQAREIEVETEQGYVTAFQETVAPAISADQRRKLYRSPTTLTFATMCAVAINEPKVSLSPFERAEVNKVTVWPLIGDTKAVAVRPRISDEQRKRALQLMGERPFRIFDERKRYDVRAVHYDVPIELQAAA